MKKVQISLSGTEISDTSAIEKSLNQLSGLRNIEINSASKIIKADCEEYIQEDQIISTIRQAGYQVSEVIFEKSNTSSVIEENVFTIKQSDVSSNWRNKLIWSWVLSIPLFGLILFEEFFNPLVLQSWIIKILVLFLSLPVVFFIGWKIILSGFKGLISFSFDVNSLITLSSVVAFLTGILSWFTEIKDYSAIAGVMMAIFITGKYLENKVIGETGKEVKSLKLLFPQSVRIIVDGKEILVPLSEVQVGDLIVMLTGDHVAADGQVVKGHGTLNEQMLTSEDGFMEKKIGDIILAGSIVQDGRLVVEVTKIGKDTFLSKVSRVIESTQGTKISIQNKINKITKIIAPTTIVFSILIFSAWYLFTQDINYSLNAALAVLIVACPSSLGLAIPVVLLIGTGLAARRGILVRNGESFQTIEESKKIIFDKIGTLTKDNPEVSYVFSLIKEKELLEFAASLIHLENEILAKNILDYAGLKRYKKVNNFNKISRNYLEGEIGDKKVIIGNRKTMIKNSIALQSLGPRIKEYEDSGKNILIIAINKKISGIIALSNNLKEDSIKSVMDLQRLKYKIFILTEDNETVSKVLSRKLNNSQIIFDISKEETLKKINEIKSSGGVIFVASPAKNVNALNQSNVGIVMGKETDLGHGTEDILVTKSSVKSIVEIARLSKEVQNKIGQNLFWALGYNMIAIPLAAFGLLNPLIAEIAMLASSLSVLINANLLRTKRIS